MLIKLAGFAALAILLLIGLFFFGFGIFVLILGWSADLQQHTFQFVLEHPFILSSLGGGLALIGIALLSYVFSFTRRQTIPIWTGPLSVAVDENVIYQYVEDYWEGRFPHEKIPFRLTFKKYALQVAAEIPSMPREDQKLFATQVKEDFKDLFGRVIGYPYEVKFVAHFRPL